MSLLNILMFIIFLEQEIAKFFRLNVYKYPKNQLPTEMGYTIYHRTVLVLDIEPERQIFQYLYVVSQGPLQLVIPFTQ